MKKELSMLETSPPHGAQCWKLRIENRVGSLPEAEQQPIQHSDSTGQESEREPTHIFFKSTEIRITEGRQYSKVQ